MSKLVIASDSEAIQRAASAAQKKSIKRPWRFSWIASSLTLLAMTMLLCPLTALALTLEQPLPDPAQETRARALFSELRCAVCQSESLADSPADVARDMRQEIRTQIAAGKPNEEIVSYLVSRYGDAVLMRPPLKASTALLWLGPLLIVALALFLAAQYFRHSGARRNPEKPVRRDPGVRRNDGQ